MMQESNLSRLELHNILCDLMASMGLKPNVYFQPPNNVKMGYPAIRYNLSGVDDTRADDDLYHVKKRYSLTVIDTNPDSVIWMKVMNLKFTKFDRFYTAPGLNHWAFSLYY